MNLAQLMAAAIRSVVDLWMESTSFDERVAALADPAALSGHLGASVERLLDVPVGHADAVRRHALGSAVTHLERVFPPGALAETPQSFLYVPDLDGTLAGRAAALAAHAFLHLETISYGSENDGALFVNLVALPGEGRMPEKSKDKMRGHTDAVTFPFSGETHPSNPRIAPSPDFVTLVGLRNPNAVGTTVMPLDAILSKLNPDEIAELKKAQYSIQTQDTFKTGILDELGHALTLLDVPLLKDAPNTTHVRFSHRNVSSSEDYPLGEQAAKKFKEACEEVAEAVVVAPGDVLLVSNRICLHGRGVVGEAVGGEARWLLRTYALDTTDLDELRRHYDDRPLHVLYP